MIVRSICILICSMGCVEGGGTPPHGHLPREIWGRGDTGRTPRPPGRTSPPSTTRSSSGPLPSRPRRCVPFRPDRRHGLLRLTPPPTLSPRGGGGCACWDLGCSLFFFSVHGPPPSNPHLTKGGSRYRHERGGGGGRSAQRLWSEGLEDWGVRRVGAPLSGNSCH